MQNSGKVHPLELSYADYLSRNKSLLKLKLGQYVIVAQIGRGNYGTVYKGMSLDGKDVVAVKVIDLYQINHIKHDKLRAIQLRLARTESQLMMECDSEHVVKCYNVYQNAQLKIIVMEYCSGPTLKEQIGVAGKFDQKRAILVLKQLICGIGELHKHRIIHRDLKPDNIISHNGIYKIVDFGFSKQLENQAADLRQTCLGTVTTMAPEVVNRQPYGLKADIWSLGAIFFYMVFGKTPFDSRSYDPLLKQIKASKLFEPECITCNQLTASKKVSSFLKEVIKVDVKTRLNWRQMLEHPLFAEDSDLPGALVIDVPIQQSKIEIDISDELQVTPAQEQEQLLLSQSNGAMVPLGMPAKLVKVETKEYDRLQEQESAASKDFLWAKYSYLQCQKSQLIFREVVTPIIQNQLLDLSERKVVEMLYLLLSRCCFEMSVIDQRLRREGHNFQVRNLSMIVAELYREVRARWKEYEVKLTKIQDEVVSMIKDWFCKKFQEEEQLKRDMLMNGIEGTDYDKQQKVRYIFDEFIVPLRGEISPVKGVKTAAIRHLLDNYVKISLLTEKQMGEQSLSQWVRRQLRINE